MGGRLMVSLVAAHLGIFVLGLVAFAAADSITGAVVVALSVATGASLVATGALALGVLTSLRRIDQAVRRAASGELDQRVPVGGALPDLSNSLNELVSTLGARLQGAAQERSRLESVLNSSIDAVLAVDADAKITFANSAAEALLERPHDELVGNPFGWVVPEEGPIEALRASRQEGESRSVLSERPNHQYLQVVTTPIASGGDWAALAVFHDVTDVRRTEQVRRDFIANVSHELRTPLASIKSLIETLDGGALDEPEMAKDFLQRANQEVDRLVRLVEELLELSRIESGRVPLAREPVDLTAVIDGAVDRLRPQATAKAVDLLWEPGDDLPTIAGDPDRLERALVNLLLNAIKFTPEGGSVRIAAQIASGAIEVSVADTGAGIAAEDLPRVFERFYKADRARGSSGTGLGLAIVKHTIEAHGGRVSAESEEGGGATFSLLLPATQDDSL